MENILRSLCVCFELFSSLLRDLMILFYYDEDKHISNQEQGRDEWDTEIEFDNTRWR